MNAQTRYEYDHAAARQWAGGGAMNQHYGAKDKLYRDVDRKWIAGVVSGMARHFGWSLLALRLVVIFLLLTPVMPAVILAYLVAALVLPSAPRAYPAAAPVPTQADHAIQAAPAAHELRQRLQTMEQRLRAMEAYVTGPQYEIDRELRRRPE